ncbi:MAG: ATP-binding protein [Muribaculaceae bacterium]|nr:ATP-binding protein [Muribaculaceae bacterium]
MAIPIDDYYKPMLDSLHEEVLHDKIKAELRGFYSCIKGNDQYIKFAMFTGITKFGIAAKMMGLAVKTEVHSSKGRCDMQILTPSYIYIFEFKINESSETALEQIHDINYLMPFDADHRTKVLIGANFLTKARTIGSWIIEKQPH